MGERAAKAKEYFQSGYNCAQSVLMAFADKTNLTEEQIISIAAPFGAGMGRMREVCGTVSGMFMAAGLILGKDSGTPQGKNEMYAITQEFANEFKKRNGSIICRELLAGVPVTSGTNAEPRTQEYYKKRPCADLCYDAAEILEEYLNK
ncbi:MAG: C_GCAxxG_C_C family protein [Spirochaetales bacterium]|nr:C_GCAxxG_C_C family protein [Spirochaetales bacterium]